jgi:excisionase family DNA binding protein
VIDARPLLTARQVAERLSVHPNTVKRLIRSGALEAYRLGRRGDVRVSEAQLAKLLGGSGGAG